MRRGCLPQCMVGYYTPPGADIPPVQTPPGPDPLREQTPLWEQTPWSRHTPLLGADPPPRETATAADGTHPTGMHSCCISTLTSRLKGGGGMAVHILLLTHEAAMRDWFSKISTFGNVSLVLTFSRKQFIYHGP